MTLSISQARYEEGGGKYLEWTFEWISDERPRPFEILVSQCSGAIRFVLQLSTVVPTTAKPQIVDQLFTDRAAS